MSSHSDSEIKPDLAVKLKKALPMKAKLRERHLSLNCKNYLKHSNTLSQVLQEQRLLTSVSTNNTEMAERLLEVGVSSNTADGQLRSALHFAVSKGYVEMVELLLRFGANPNAQDIVRNTPLHLAACTSNLQIITKLINAGADIRSMDMHGRNPLQLAESKLQLLRKSWKSGAIEMIQLRQQLQEIVDIMISMFRNSQTSRRGNENYNVGNLELMKLSLNTGQVEEVDDQMTKLETELQQFTIK